MKIPSLLKTNTVHEAGFTIIEFMISTTIFAVLLLLALTAISHYSQDYFKASLSNSVSSSLQSVSDNVEQSLEISRNISIPTPDKTLCTASDEFLYNIGAEMPTEEPIPIPGMVYAVYEFPDAGDCYTIKQLKNNTVAKQAMAQGQSLLGTHYRLLRFNVSQIGDTSEYSVDLKIAYTSGGTNDVGDDLLCSTTVSSSTPGACNSSTANLMDYSDSSAQGIVCRGGDGNQFCDVAELQFNIGYHVN